MQIKEISLSKLKPAKYNPRKDLQPDDPEYIKIKKSIETFGAVDPIVWNERSGNIVGGHQRYKIYKELGWKKVKVSVVDLDEKAEAVLNIALNKISGEWDYPALKDLIAEIDTGEFDIHLTGFDQGELNFMFGYADPDPINPNGSGDSAGSDEIKVKITVQPGTWAEHSLDIIDKLTQIQKIYKKRNFIFSIDE